MENAAFKDFLQEYADIKGLSPKKISDLTGVPERYIEALLAGDSPNLPPPPYVRGYISKLALVLDFDKEEMWRLYKKEFNLTGSGASDTLPINRFAIKKINKKMALVIFVVLLFLIYLGWNFNKFLGLPALELIYPASENLIVAQPLVSVEGKTDINNKLTINGVEIYVDDDGHFQKDFSLDPGLNTVEIIASKLLGRESKTIKKIIYQPVEETNQEPTEEKNGS